MRTEAVGALLVTVGVLVVSCGPGDTLPTPSAPDQSTSGQTTIPDPTTTSGPTTTSEPTDVGADVESYLVEMSNLEADVVAQLGDFECSYNEQFSPGFCGGGFVEEGEEFEPPPEPTEEEQFAYQRGLWLGMFDIRLAHADVLGAVSPPQGFETEHQAYVDSYRAYFTYLRDQVAGFVDLDELFEFFNVIFDPLAPVPPDQEQLLLAMVETCRSLEDLGSDAGFRTDLGCPSPPEEAVSIDVEISDEWSATPNPLPVGDGLVRMTITNTGSEAIQPVVIEIWEGDPLNLPIVDGVVDISQSGFFDPASGFAEFGLSYAGENWEVVGEPLELPPGESVEAAIWSEGTIVVLDYRPGEFEDGAYVVVERSGSR